MKQINTQKMTQKEREDAVNEVGADLCLRFRCPRRPPAPTCAVPRPAPARFATPPAFAASLARWCARPTGLKPL